MIVIMRDAVMPDCCNTCVCSEGYGCGITGTMMTTKEMEERPDWCPLEEVEPCEDTISRQAAIDTLRKMQTYKLFAGDDMFLIDQAEAQTELMMLPSAQPEIVRCKDCKHHWTYKCMDGMPIERCDLEQTFYDANIDYCSLAEKRET